MGLTEIETAAERLSVAEQQELLRHLEALQLRKHQVAENDPREGRVRQLNSLRTSVGSSTTMMSGEQVLAKLCADWANFYPGSPANIHCNTLLCGSGPTPTCRSMFRH
jgi:hypothetical protein